jgi:hypothetical protein
MEEHFALGVGVGGLLEFKAEFLVTEPGHRTCSLKDSGTITTFIMLDISYLRRQELAVN